MAAEITRRPRWQGPGRCAAAVLLVLAAAGVAATPAEDHQRGQLAYQRGDVVAAMSALRAAAKAGHAQAQSLLAFILDQADFSDEALRYYEQAALQDDAEGHAGLASLYLAGRGVAKDEKRALQHFSKAAEQGHTGASHSLANAWMKGQLGLDAQAEPERARQAIVLAAERGHVASMDALAQGHRSGRWGLAVDAAAAARWTERAAASRQRVASDTLAARPAGGSVPK